MKLNTLVKEYLKITKEVHKIFLRINDIIVGPEDYIRNAAIFFSQNIIVRIAGVLVH